MIPQESMVYISQAEITAIENAGDALIRLREVEVALPLYTLALRLRMDSGIHPQRRHDDP